jgi:hypothetical protein
MYLLLFMFLLLLPRYLCLRQLLKKNCVLGSYKKKTSVFKLLSPQKNSVLGYVCLLFH